MSQVFTVDRSQLVDKIGAVSPARVREILDGLRVLTEPGEPG